MLSSVLPCDLISISPLTSIRLHGQLVCSYGTLGQFYFLCWFKDDNPFFTSLSSESTMTRESGPSFPGWSATCQYILSENHLVLSCVDDRDAIA